MKYYTVSQASNIIGVSRMTVYNWIKSGKIDFMEIYGENNSVGYAIPATEVSRLTSAHKIVEKAIKRTFNEYGDVLDKLADE